MNAEKLARELAEAGKEFYRRGWVLGTSGNFSALLSRKPMEICITASGVEKGSLDETRFLEINETGEIIKGLGSPSAETSLHQTIYRNRRAESVLHTHSVWGTILSDVYFDQGFIEISGYEMLKGLAGNSTHAMTERVPIIENSQDYEELAATLEKTLLQYPDCHGVYLRKHGLYAWGDCIAETKRHVEIFEFLFEVLGRRLKF